MIYLMSEKNDLKKVIQDNLPGDSELSDELLGTLNELLNAVDELKEVKGFDNEITFAELHEKTKIPFDILSPLITYALLNQRIVGFINDNGTEGPEDDILLIRETRLIDTDEFY
jgi:hypothetical protein